MMHFRLITWVVLVSACAAFSEGQAPGKESKIKAGVLDLEVTNMDDASAAAASQTLVRGVSELGFYDAYSQAALQDAFRQIKTAFPRRCRDPRCVRDIGKATGMDRMVYGAIDKNSTTYGIRLELLDVASKQTVATVSLESEPGVKVEDLIAAATARLHGHTEDSLNIKLSTYFGPEIHHEKQMLISSGAFLGVGLVWLMANGLFNSSGEVQVPTELADVKLSGIPGLSGVIPMCGRPAALANSYLAVADDAYGVLYNPAGAAWVANAEGAVAYQYRFGFLNNVTASFVNKATREIGFGHAFRYVGDPEGMMTETYFTSAFAYKISRMPGSLRPLSVGASLKLNSIAVKGVDGVEATSQGTGAGMGLDLGLLWELSEQIRYGMVFQDLLSFTHWNNTARKWDYSEASPVTLNMGGAFRAGYTTLLVANGKIPLYRDQAWEMAGGVEQEFFRVLKIRLGVQKGIQSELDTPWRLTGGVGIDVVTEALFGKYVSLDVSYEHNVPIREFYVVNVSGRFGF